MRVIVVKDYAALSRNAARMVAGQITPVPENSFSLQKRQTLLKKSQG
jgi:hypothetical protein